MWFEGIAPEYQKPMYWAVSTTVIAFIGLVYWHVRRFIDRRRMAALLAQFAALTEPIVIHSRSPEETDVEAYAEYVRWMLRESGNTWLDPYKDVVAIPYNGYYDGKSLIGMSFGNYTRYIQQVQLRAMKEFHVRAAKKDPQAASENITGQSFEWGVK